MFQKRKLLDVAILLFVIGYTVLGQETFNCRRHTGICGNGGSCNKTTLQCDCATGFHGYRCHIPNASPCTNTSFCGTNGECYVANGTNVCGCNLAYLGARCEINRAEVTCDGSGMDVTFRILKQGFNGVIMVNDTTNNKVVELPKNTCTFADDPENAGYLKMTVKVGQPTGNASNECLSSAYTEVNDAVKGKSTTVYFRVAYASVMSTLDVGYSIRCDLKKDDLQIFAEVSNVVFDPNSGTTINKNATYSPVKFEIKKPDGTALGSVVKLGDKLNLQFILTDTNSYKNLTVVSVTANNTLEGNVSKTFAFVRQGCPTTPGQQIAGEQTVVTDAQGNPGRSISLDVFQFPDSHKVGLVATMAVCETGNDTKCQVPADCNAVRQAAQSASSGTGGTGAGGGATNATGGATTGGNSTTGNGTTPSGGGNSGQPSGSGANNSTTANNGTNPNNGAANSGSTTANNGTSPNNGAAASGQSANGASANNGTAANSGTGTGASGKRKRRATTDSEQVVSTVLNIRGPEALTSAAGTAAPVDQVEQCFTQSEILAAIIILGTTVCILFIACFVMSCMLVKRRGSKSSFGSLSNKKLSDRFHIPRAHVNEHINEAYTSL